MANEFKSAFTQQMEAFLEHRKQSGVKSLEGDIGYLKKLDRFLVCHGISNIMFGKDLAEKWKEPLPNESEIGRYKRINATKRFMEYLFAKGYPVFQFRDIKAPRSNFTPHIYSDDEVMRYFEAVDSYEPPVNKKNRIQIPVLFRIIYCCGTRITETLRIRKCDVDLESGIIRLSETKNAKQRYVVMSSSLHELMKEYAGKTFFLLSDNDYIFTTLKGTAIDADVVRDLHIMFLSQAKIPYLSGVSGPRIHDWRHTFAVNSFRQMIEKGYDMYVSLPVISAYMGHDSIAATEKYLRLTESMYPYLEDKFSKTINEIFEEGIS